MRRRSTIQPEEVRQYYREGYLLKKCFIPKAILNNAVRIGESLVQKKLLTNKDHSCACTTVDALSQDTGFASILESMNLWKAMEMLLGNQHLVYHFSNLSMKKPNQQNIAHWHRDFSHQYMTFVTSNFLSAFIPLTVFNDVNGAPKIIPGSNHVADGTVKLLKTLNIRTTRRYPLSQSLFCSPGDVIFIHSKTRYCCEHNNSDKPRINLTLQAGTAQRPVSLKTRTKERFGASRLHLKWTGGHL